MTSQLKFDFTPVNMATRLIRRRPYYFGPLVTVLTGFHCICVQDSYTVRHHFWKMQCSLGSHEDIWKFEKEINKNRLSNVLPCNVLVCYKNFLCRLRSPCLLHDVYNGVKWKLTWTKCLSWAWNSESQWTASYILNKFVQKQDESIPHSHKQNNRKILKNLVHLWTF